MQLPVQPVIPWLSLVAQAGADPTPPLAAAVAAVVGIAARRARAAGELGILRDAVTAALDAADPPAAEPEDGGPATLADADPRLEAFRLRRLARRLGPA